MTKDNLDATNLPQGTINNDAQEIISEVLKRLDHSYSKYGDQYLLANIESELNEEIYDIVGWPLLLAIRLKQISRGIVKELNGDYLDKFILRAKTEYLLQLQERINIELEERQKK